MADANVKTQLEQNLANAKAAKDDEWAERVQARLEELKPKPKPKKKAPAKKAEATDDKKDSDDDDS